MKVHRIRLRNYKGVDDVEVEFALDGVTIIEGPNEVGKTSLAEALTLVLEQLDSSTRADIRDAKPVHNDAGPWVEAELSTGPYRLIIEKRWLRSPMTHLRVLEPKAEEITGREGHERLRVILAETLDEQLFRALHYYQGVNVEQAALGQSTSLSSALDAAASGQSLAGQREANLVDLVHGEWLRYFTPSGRPTAERASAERNLAALKSSVDDAQAELDALDSLAEEHQSLTTEIARLREDQVNRQKLFEQETKLWESVQDKKVAVAQAKSAHTTATGASLDARRRADERAALRKAEVDTMSALVAAEKEVEKDRPAVEAVRLVVNNASDRRNAARKARVEAEHAEQQARSHEEYLRRLISRELWAERLANVRAGQAAVTEARNVLATNLMDEGRLAEIEGAALSVTETSAQLAASSTAVSVEALANISMSTDAGSRSLVTGEIFEDRVDGELTFELNQLARVRVTAGSPERLLRATLEEAEDKLRELLRDAGLAEATTPAQCRLAAQQRRDAVASETQASKLVADNLRDLTIERLEQEVAEDETFISAFQAKNGPDVIMPSSLEEARPLLAEAERLRSEAAEEEDAADAELAVARQQEAEVSSAANSRATKLQIAITLHDGAVEALQLARDQHSDEVLQAALDECSKASEDAAKLLATAEQTLDDLDPDSVEARLSNLKSVVDRVATELSEADRKVVEVKTKLAVKGEEGLQDHLDDLASQLERATREHVRVGRAARAADLVWRRLVANREEAQRSYVGPYRAEIERLGRIVYGSTFSVEIDHSSLAIESRTLNGRTVGFNRLSMGAKEQLCVIARLACAGIVAGTGGGGAPVIIDDALGWTDPNRLSRIGAAISAASHDCQVIVLTCEPMRYSSVGNAVVRHLTASVAGS